MSEYRKIREKYDKLFQQEIEKLQSGCVHKPSEWLEEYWAAGHTSGQLVKICNICGKELKRSYGFIEHRLDKTAEHGIRFITHVKKPKTKVELVGDNAWMSKEQKRGKSP